MGSQIAVLKADFSTDIADGNYDLVVTALGYESRATYVASKYHGRATKKLAWAFEDRQELSFHENADWFTANGYMIARGANLADRKSVV